MASFEQTVIAQDADMDENGHVNNIVYLRWVQDIAGAHWRAVALPDWQMRFTWVVLRHEIDYLKPSFAGDMLTLRTWVGNARGARFERNVEVRRGEVVCARAVTTWAMLDVTTLRPARVPADMISRFGPGAGPA